MSTITKSGTGQKQRLASTRKRTERFVSLDGMLSVEDLTALPDTKPRYELVNGKLVQKTTTKRKHSLAAGNLLFELLLWSRTTDKGWRFFTEGTGVKIDQHNAYVPDVVGFGPGAVLDPEESIGGTPFLDSEVLSKSTARRDRVDKLRDYASIGVQIYIIVDPDKQTVEIHTLQNGTYAAPQVLKDNDVWQPAELPGLTVELQKLWFA
jgi:Uma2 family endonuclease